MLTSATDPDEDPVSNFATRNGFALLPARPGALPVTMEHVAELLDALDREEMA